MSSKPVFEPPINQHRQPELYIFSNNYTDSGIIKFPRRGMKFHLYITTFFERNTVMKKQKKIALYTLTAIILTITCVIGVSATFNDVKNSPYKEAIEALAELQITVGNGNNEFKGNDNVTRQQMTLFAARLLTGNEINGFEKAENSTAFTDITDPTYFKSISYCYTNNIIVGRTETTFDPTGNVSVQEAITIMVRALGYNGLSYPDGYIATAKDFGLLTNLDNVTYTAPMTRGQVAQLLDNTLHNIHLAGEFGKSLYDVQFSEKPKLGYFEITSVEELKANYTCISIHDHPHWSFPAYTQYGWERYNGYVIEDVAFMGYTGDILYYFAKSETAPCKRFIRFEFDIMGEIKSLGPVNIWIENSSDKLTAAEAKDLIETFNLRMACFTGHPVAEYQVPIYSDGTPAIKDGAPKDIYKATVDGYTSLSFHYPQSSYTYDEDQNHFCLNISPNTSPNPAVKGCELKGNIELREDWRTEKP